MPSNIGWLVVIVLAAFAWMSTVGTLLDKGVKVAAWVFAAALVLTFWGIVWRSSVTEEARMRTIANQRLLAEWAKGWVCLRCGARFKPEK